jgi:teichuronic acid biosynthesis glycosyltransferase TuaC
LQNSQNQILLKVLYVFSGNSKAFTISPFIQEQTRAISQKNVEIDFFLIKGRGIMGYIKYLLIFYKKINTSKPDIIHAHYGLSGLFACLQFKVPVITTFHGSDVNLDRIRPFSKVALLLSKYSIFVSEKLAKKARAKKNYSIIPCGVYFDLYFPIEKKVARQKLGFKEKEILVLFSNSFDYYEKNYPLAKKAVDILDENVNLIELKGYSREEVNLLLNACDVALMTSFSEGSPQFIKEAMACNCPIVSTDVGDVKAIIDDIAGCFISTYKVEDVANAINEALLFNKRTQGRKEIKHLSNELIAQQIVDIYLKITSK